MSVQQDAFVRDLSFEEQLKNRLAELGVDLMPVSFSEIDSTNQEAKRMAQRGNCERVLITAAYQSAGRGRMGRQFYSPADTGAYFTLLYPVPSLREAVTVTSAASVAVMRAIRTLTGKQTQIKWVNDLYLKQRKICGILAESVATESGAQVILGVGINLSTAHFPTELEGIAGSLEETALQPHFLIAEVCRELVPFLNAPQDRSWLADYRAYSSVIGKRITWIRQEERHSGIALDVDADGALLVRDEEGENIRLFTGEISIKTQ